MPDEKNGEFRGSVGAQLGEIHDRLDSLFNAVDSIRGNVGEIAHQNAKHSAYLNVLMGASGAFAVSLLALFIKVFMR